MVFGTPSNKGEQVDETAEAFAKNYKPKAGNFKPPLSPLEQVDDLKEKVKNSIGEEKVRYKKELDKLQRKLRALGFGPRQRAATAKAVDELTRKNAEERKKASEEFEQKFKENEERLKKAAKKAVPVFPKEPEPKPAKPPATDREKLAAATALLGSPVKEKKPSPFTRGFSLPQFTEENSTTIIVGCLIVCAVLELSLGTKFVQLWNYAFSPKTDITGATTIIGNGKQPGPPGLNLNPLGRALGPGTLPDDWGIPNTFDYIEGAVF